MKLLAVLCGDAPGATEGHYVMSSIAAATSHSAIEVYPAIAIQSCHSATLNARHYDATAITSALQVNTPATP